MKSNALYFISPKKVEIREELLPPLGNNQVLIAAVHSAISAGSEMLIYKGLAPKNIKADENIKSLKGYLKFPLKYGYSMVGKITDIGKNVKKNWLNKMVFSFQPHQSTFISTINEVMLIPEDIPPEDAVFLPNVESAVNFIMDGNPQIGENILVLGQGIVGLLTSSVLTLHPIKNLVTVDNYSKRRHFSKKVGANKTYSVEEISNILNQGKSNNPEIPEFDLVFELSGNPEAIDNAIELSTYDGRIVIGSWYGDKKAPINLGGEFHRKRIKIISSQVSAIAPIFSGRWNKKRRFELVWEMIRKIKPSKFITHRYNFENTPKAYQKLDENPEECIQVILTYSDKKIN